MGVITIRGSYLELNLYVSCKKSDSEFEPIFGCSRRTLRQDDSLEYETFRKIVGARYGGYQGLGTFMRFVSFKGDSSKSDTLNSSVGST